jgi:hypothetical protein
LARAQAADSIFIIVSFLSCPLLTKSIICFGTCGCHSLLYLFHFEKSVIDCTVSHFTQSFFFMRIQAEDSSIIIIILFFTPTLKRKIICLCKCRHLCAKSFEFSVACFPLETSSSCIALLSPFCSVKHSFFMRVKQETLPSSSLFIFYFCIDAQNLLLWYVRLSFFLVSRFHYETSSSVLRCVLFCSIFLFPRAIKQQTRSSSSAAAAAAAAASSSHFFVYSLDEYLHHHLHW